MYASSGQLVLSSLLCFVSLYTVIEFIPGTDKYFPILYFNDYWNLNSDYQPINDTCK